MNRPFVMETRCPRNHRFPAAILLLLLASGSVAEDRANEEPSVVVPHRHAADIDCVAFHPSGRLFATANTRGEVHIRLVEDATLVRTFYERGARAEALAFSSDGAFLHLRQSVGAHTVWDWEERRVAFGDPSTALLWADFFEADFVVCTGPHLIRIDLSTGAREIVARMPESLIRYAIAPSDPDGMLFFTRDGSLSRLSLTSETIEKFTQLGGPTLDFQIGVAGMIPGTESRYFLYGPEGLYRIDVEMKSRSFSILHLSDEVFWKAKPAPSGKISLKGSSGPLLLLDVSDASMTPIQAIQHEGWDMLPNSDRIAFTTLDACQIGVLDGDTVQEIEPLIGSALDFGNVILSGQSGLRVALNRDATRLGWLTPDGTFLSWSLREGFEATRCPLELERVRGETSIQYLSDGHLMLVSPRSVQVFDSKTGAILATRQFDDAFATYPLAGTDRCGHRIRRELFMTEWDGTDLIALPTLAAPIAHGISFDSTASASVITDSSASGTTFTFQSVESGASQSFQSSRYVHGYQNEILVRDAMFGEIAFFEDESLTRLFPTQPRQKAIRQFPGWSDDMRSLFDPRTPPSHPDLAFRTPPGLAGASFSIVDLSTGEIAWEARFWKPWDRLQNHQLIGYTPDGSGLWTVGVDARPILWNLATGSPIARVTLLHDVREVAVELHEGSVACGVAGSELIQVIESGGEQNGFEAKRFADPYSGDLSEVFMRASLTPPESQ